MNPFLSVLLCIYAFIKYFFGYNHQNNIQQCSEAKKYLLRFIFGLLTLVIVLISGILLLPFFIFRKAVDLYLRITLGSAYGGLLYGQDADLLAFNERSVIRTVMIINVKEDGPDIWETFLKIAKNMHLANYKSSSTVKDFLGYFYYLKDQVKFEDIIVEKRIGNREYITRNEFLGYLNTLRHWEKEDRIWTITYFPQRIFWSTSKQSCKQVAAVISMQHCVSDGANAMKYFIKHFTNDSYKIPQSNYLELLKNIPKFTPDDAYISQNIYDMNAELDSYLPISSNEQRPYLAIFSEETPKYLDLVKKVKTKSGVDFASVVIDALSCSIRDYFKRKQQSPKDILFVTTVRPEQINLVFKSIDADSLLNDIGHQFIKIPPTLDAMATNHRLRTINDTLKRVRRSVESTFMYRTSEIMPILPSSIARTTLKTIKNVSLITNMSGLQNLVFDGHSVESIFFFITHSRDLPFTFCIISLDGKLQLTLSSSEKYVSSRQELQEILDGTLAYIDKHAEEIQAL